MINFYVTSIPAIFLSYANFPPMLQCYWYNIKSYHWGILPPTHLKPFILKTSPQKCFWVTASHRFFKIFHQSVSFFTLVQSITKHQSHMNRLYFSKCFTQWKHIKSFVVMLVIELIIEIMWSFTLIECMLSQRMK